MAKIRARRASKARPDSTPRPETTRARHSTPKTQGPAKTSVLVVGVGASAGGLEAFRKLMGTVPRNTGIAFILVQHLDPSHESMMVDLLSTHTALTVCQAKDELPIEGDHLYVIPPGTYLSIAEGKLHLS